MDPLTIGILAGLVLNTVGNVGNGIANYKNSAKADRALYAVDSIRTQIKENNASAEQDINAIKADLDNAWNNINHLRYQNPQSQPMQQPQQQQIIQPPVQQQVAQPQQSIQQQLQPTQFDELIEVLKQTNKNIGDLKSEVLDLKQQGK
jgi:type II secretory pathway component PulM